MTLGELLDALQAMADAPSDEQLPFSQLDHGLQCAFVIDQGAGRDDALVVAGLVHDIGAFLGAGEEEHGRAGADAVRSVLGERIAGLVDAHVPAKRYLVAVDPGYPLSPVSRTSLARQGGPMGPEEVEAFAADPLCEAAVTLRRADDAAKTPGRVVPGLDRWIPLVRQVAR